MFSDVVLLFLFLYISVCLCENYVDKVTRYGKLRGVIETVHSGKVVEKYLGVPYALPPVGKLRLEPPVPARPWDDVILTATELPPACPQPAEGVVYIEHHVPGFNKTSEDCLYLNIYTPKGLTSPGRYNPYAVEVYKKAGCWATTSCKGQNAIAVPKIRRTRPFPVLFFVHGGSYYNGMGAMFEGGPMSVEGSVVVTVNYRLGPLGFLSSGDSYIPGNYGLLDLVTALKWVHDNIADFGGDPSHVTIDGHSAGGCSAGLLMISPMTKGLFRNVIIQSGSPLAHWSVTRRPQGPDVHFKVFASSLGCLSNSSLQMKYCLQSIPSERMLHHISYNYVTSPSLSPQFRPVIDDKFLTDTPERLMQYGDFQVENVLTGATQDEGLMAAMPLIEDFGGEEQGIKELLTLMYCFRGDLPKLPNIVDIVLDLYGKWPFRDIGDSVERIFAEIVGDYFITAPTHKMAQVLSSRNTSVYVYNYEYKSIFAQWKGVIHGSELFYLSGFPLTGHTNFRYDETDKKTAKVLLRLWTSFMKTGLPTLQPHRDFTMKRYTPLNPQYSRIYQGTNHPYLEQTFNFKTNKMDFWNRRIPLLAKQYKNQHGYYDPNIVNRNYVINGPDSWALIATCIGLSVMVIILFVAYCKTRNRMQELIQQNSARGTHDSAKKELLLKRDNNTKYSGVTV